MIFFYGQPPPNPMAIPPINLMTTPSPNSLTTKPPYLMPTTSTNPDIILNDTLLSSLQDNVSPNFKCKKYGKSFVNNFSLKDHMWFRHGVEGT